jgi:general secretion pathway protein C
LNLSISTKHYLWAANALILGLAVWMAVSFAMSVLGRRLEGVAEVAGPVVAEGGQGQRLRALDEYVAIARHNIFRTSQAGEALPAEDAAEPVAVAEADNLRLRGVVHENDIAQNAAILEDLKSGAQDIYRAGDKIGQSELMAIGPDHVILKREGREVKLHMFLDETRSAAPARTQQLPAPVTPGQSEDNGDQDPIAQQTSPGQWIVSRQALTEQMGDLNFFLSNVMIKPHFQDGQPAGFQIAAVKPGTPMHALGMRRGDIVKSVNGISVTKPDDLVNMYAQVQQMEQVQVEVERGGEIQTFTYVLK